MFQYKEGYDWGLAIIGIPTDLRPRPQAFQNEQFLSLLSSTVPLQAQSPPAKTQKYLVTSQDSERTHGDKIYSVR